MGAAAFFGHKAVKQSPQGPRHPAFEGGANRMTADLWVLLPTSDFIVDYWSHLFIDAAVVMGKSLDLEGNDRKGRVLQNKSG